MISALGVAAQINVLLERFNLAFVHTNDELDHALGVLCVPKIKVLNAHVLDNVFKLLLGEELFKAAQDGAPLWDMRLFRVFLDVTFEGAADFASLKCVKVSERLVEVLFGRPIEESC
jgi:hypothetical protein